MLIVRPNYIVKDVKNKRCIEMLNYKENKNNAFFIKFCNANSSFSWKFKPIIVLSKKIIYAINLLKYQKDAKNCRQV